MRMRALSFLTTVLRFLAAESEDKRLGDGGIGERSGSKCERIHPWLLKTVDCD